MTAEADSIVAADYAATFLAFPLFPFLLQKVPHAVLFDECQVLYHAQMIESAVPLVERKKAAARKITTLMTEAYKAFAQQLALFAHVCAVLSARSATGAV